jgi:preprotein translocase subunit SecF
MSAIAIPTEKTSVPGSVIGAFKRLYRGETKFDFVRRRRWWYLFSSIVILAGLVSLAVRGLNYSIEFVGGQSWEFPSATLTVAQVKAAITPYGLGGATITTLGSSNGSSREIQVEAKLTSGESATAQAAEVTQVAGVLAKAAGVSTSSVSTELVGPTWGSEVTHKAIEALIVFLIVIGVYISIFFEWKMALAAIIAVIHDIAVAVGIYSLAGLSMTPDTLVAFLTILGYSLYDTIVVFDRIRDNVKGLGATGKLSYTDVVNLSMNQTLARSINTSLVAILPILAVLVLGAEILGAVTLQYFGLALFVGLLSGAYSSIFIASPIVAQLKEREPRYTSIRDKLAARGTTSLLLTPAAVAGGALGGEDTSSVRRRGQKGRTGGGAGGSGRLQPGAARGRPGAVAPKKQAAVTAPETDELDLDETTVSGNGAGDEKPRTTSAKATAASRQRPGAGSGARAGAGAGARAGARPGGPGARPTPRPRKKKKR